MSENSPMRVGNLAIQYLVDGTQFGGMGFFELQVPPGSNVPPPRSQTHNEECVHVFEGALRYSVDSVTRDLRAGDWMRTPKGSVSGRCLRRGGWNTVRARVGCLALLCGSSTASSGGGRTESVRASTLARVLVAACAFAAILLAACAAQKPKGPALSPRFYGVWTNVVASYYNWWKLGPDGAVNYGIALDLGKCGARSAVVIAPDQLNVPFGNGGTVRLLLSDSGYLVFQGDRGRAVLRRVDAQDICRNSDGSYFDGAPYTGR